LDLYLADLQAVFEINPDLKSFCINCLAVPQARIVASLGESRGKIFDHLPDLAALPNSVNSDLAKGFTVPQADEKA